MNCSYLNLIGCLLYMLLGHVYRNGLMKEILMDWSSATCNVSRLKYLSREGL